MEGAVSNGVERGEEGEAVGRVVEGFARKACDRGFLSIIIAVQNIPILTYHKQCP